MAYAPKVRVSQTAYVTIRWCKQNGLRPYQLLQKNGVGKRKETAEVSHSLFFITIRACDRYDPCYVTHLEQA